MIKREEIEALLADYSEEKMQKLKVGVLLDLRDQVAELKEAILSLEKAIKKEGLNERES